MDILSKCETFSEGFMKIESTGDAELMKHRDHGWHSDYLEFTTLFEEMAKASNVLHLDGEEAIRSLQDELEKLTREIEVSKNEAAKIDAQIEDIRKVCDQLNSEIEKQKDESTNLKEEAMSSFVAIKNTSSNLAKQKKLLYLITRLTWDEKALKRDLIKGYVYDTINKDVSVFEADMKKMNNKAVISDLIWDYISTGISSEWK